MAMGQQHVSTEQQLRNRLNEIVNVLEQVEAVITVSVAALRAQNSDCDSDVARVLQRSAADRLSSELEKTSGLLVARPVAAPAPARERPHKGRA